MVHSSLQKQINKEKQAKLLPKILLKQDFIDWSMVYTIWYK